VRSASEGKTGRLTAASLRSDGVPRLGPLDDPRRSSPRLTRSRRKEWVPIDRLSYVLNGLDATPAEPLGNSAPEAMLPFRRYSAADDRREVFLPPRVFGEVPDDAAIEAITTGFASSSVGCPRSARSRSVTP
jgi:hypothetical protein